MRVEKPLDCFLCFVEGCVAEVYIDGCVGSQEIQDAARREPAFRLSHGEGVELDLQRIIFRTFDRLSLVYLVGLVVEQEVLFTVFKPEIDLAAQEVIADRE